jgi:hypothetical protein
MPQSIIGRLLGEENPYLSSMWPDFPLYAVQRCGSGRWLVRVPTADFCLPVAVEAVVIAGEIFSKNADLRGVCVLPPVQRRRLSMKTTEPMQRDETVRVVKTIDEHPRVIGLLAEIERLKREKFKLGEQYNAAVRQRDEKHVADGAAWRQQVLDLQNEIVVLQDKLIAIRQAAN